MAETATETATSEALDLKRFFVQYETKFGCL